MNASTYIYVHCRNPKCSHIIRTFVRRASTRCSKCGTKRYVAVNAKSEVDEPPQNGEFTSPPFARKAR